MTVDEALFALAEPVESDRPWPRPACPACQVGYVRFAKPDEYEDHASASAHGDPDWDPEWVSGTFTIKGQCENPGCQLIVHGTGDYQVAYAEKSVDEHSRYQTYASYYRLKHLHPPMLLMSIPKTAPDQMKEGVLGASRVLFTAANVAATALRATVESFMTTEGISPTRANGQFRPAHERIEEWGKVDAARQRVADLFLAVKWLGNAGTHEGANLTTKQVLDGAGLLDEAFHRLFTGPDVDARASLINSAKGPL